MDAQNSKFNFKIILAALVAVIIGILIAFYFSYAQSENQISFLEQEKEILVKDLTLMKADVDRLTARNEVDEIELQKARSEVSQLLDSVGRLTFTIDKLREFKTELRRLEAKNDSLKLKNDFLKYNNMQLADKYEQSQAQVRELIKTSNAIAQAEAQERQKILEMNKELKVKKYLKLDGAEGSGIRVRGNKTPVQTTKASAVSKLKGCVTILTDLDMMNQEKILYLQFLNPNKQVIEDNANTINVNGNVYSKKIEMIFLGKETPVCDFITVPEGSLTSGTYTLNVFENERLLETVEFQLK